jgi:hypothetical protein
LSKTYSEAAREVGASLKVPVADIWTAFMTTTGWQEGQPLVGSRDLPNNEQFSSLFTDGMCACSILTAPFILIACLQDCI